METGKHPREDESQQTPGANFIKNDPRSWLINFIITGIQDHDAPLRPQT